MMFAILVLVGIAPCVVWSQNVTHAKALKTKLFETNGYDKKIRPTVDQTDAVATYVSFSLLSINELDEVAETLKTTGFLVVEWTDEFLRWDPADYGGIGYYHYPQDDIWKPDIALINSVEKFKSLGVTALNVKVESTGTVIWYPFEIFQSTCSIDITFFPFDVQTCKLSFAAWSYTKFEVQMMEGADGINLEHFQTNSEWSLIYSEAAVEDKSDEASVTYTLIIQRKPRYTVLSIIIPIFMLSVLNLFVFVLPCDSGEKASYAVTVFLAFAVFLTVVTSTLPNNSESLSILSVYIIILTVQSTVITITTLLVIRLRQFESPVPNILSRLVDILHCRCYRGERGKVTPETELSSKKNFHASKADLNTAEKSIEENQGDWKRVAYALDRLFFSFFTLLTFVSSVVCLVYASSASRNNVHG